MHHSSLATFENNYTQLLKDAGQLTPFVYGNIPEEVDGIFYTSSNTNFFYEDIIPKKRIVCILLPAICGEILINLVSKIIMCQSRL